MATINFYLDKEDQSGKAPIFLVYQSKGRKFKFFTKEKIIPKYWDKNKQKAKHVAEAPAINDILDTIQEKIKGIERQLRMTEGQAPFEDVKALFFEDKKEKIGLFEYIDIFLQQKQVSLQNRTIQKYKTTLNDLKGYEEHYKQKLNWKVIDQSFFSKFLDYLTSVHQNSQNTLAKKVSTLKTILSEATKAGHNQNLKFQDFKVKKIKTEKVFLTQEELIRIYNLDLNNNERLDKIRDIFCFACLTGLRYSDIANFQYEWIIRKKAADGTTYQALQFHVKKTKETLLVPLNKYALEIIKKYESKFKESTKNLGIKVSKLKIGKLVLPVVSNQKMNEYIKEVCQLAQIDTPTIITKFVGKQRIDQTFPKYELVSSHAARRTFAIISLEQGMRIEILQGILGHSNIRTTMKYVFILDEIRNQEMQKTWNNFDLKK